MAVKYETPTSSVDENAIMENFDFEPNSDDTSFEITSIINEKSPEQSIITIESETVFSESIITIDSNSDDEYELAEPEVKSWAEVLTLELPEALLYKEYLCENIVDIPRFLFKKVNDQLFFIENL